MKNHIHLGLTALGLFTGVLAWPIRSEVISYTAGIDVNCPAGLGE